MSEFDKTFSSIEEKAEYYFNLYNKYKSQFESVSHELSEFESSSRELESELETQISQLEKKNKELNSNLLKIQFDYSNVKEKFEKLQKNSFKETTELEEKVKQNEEFINKLQIYIRDLEQTNDDLERSKRATMVSLEDFDLRLNQAIERNAFLENELDAKENLIFDIQRLKDETRDLQQELAVREKRSSVIMPMETSVNTNSVSSAINSGTSSTINPLIQSRNNQEHNLKRASLSNGDEDPMAQYFTHQSKKQVLDITLDMLKSVNSLESKFNLLAPQFTARLLKEMQLISHDLQILAPMHVMTKLKHGKNIKNFQLLNY